jgi:L-asparaginase/Glu-tRNA(Gln) amidotransferase subunit D
MSPNLDLEPILVLTTGGTIAEAAASRVVITHGTDTMTIKIKALAGIPDKFSG